MTADMLLEAIGMIDDELLDVEDKRPAALWRRGVVAAALVALLAALLAVGAMALDPALREAFFSVFSIGTTEKPPAAQTLPEETGGPGLRMIGRKEFDGVLSARYFQCEGFSNVYDGRLYTCGQDEAYSAPKFWYAAEYGVASVDATRVDMPLSWGGTEFRILFDYAVVNGKLQTFQWQEKLDEDPYRYGWNLRTIGCRTDAVILTLPEHDHFSGVYPMLLQLDTLEVTPLLAGVELRGYEPFAWWFTEDLRWAKLFAWDDNGVGRTLLVDLDKKTVSLPEACFDHGITEFYLLRDGSAIGKTPDSDFWYCDLTTGEQRLTLSGTERFDRDSMTGYRVIGQHGMDGYRTVVRLESGETILADLRTGQLLSLGELDWTDLTIRESPGGSHILFSWGSEKLGMLDLADGEMILLRREPGAQEHFQGWLSEDTIVIYSDPEEVAGGEHCLYVYDFGENG